MVGGGITKIRLVKPCLWCVMGTWEFILSSSFVYVWNFPLLNVFFFFLKGSRGEDGWKKK